MHSKSSLFVTVISLCLLAVTQGCTRIDHVRTRPEQCIISERGKVQLLYVVDVDGNACPGIQLFLPVITYFRMVALSDQPVRDGDWWRGLQIKNHTPVERRMSGRNDSIDSRIAAGLSYGHYQTRGHLLWIVSNSPCIIAVGSALLPPQRDPPELRPITEGMPVEIFYSYNHPERLVTQKDLDELVTDLYVMPDGPVKMYDGSADSSCAARHIKLPSPRTLRSIMDALPTMNLSVGKSNSGAPTSSISSPMDSHASRPHPSEP